MSSSIISCGLHGRNCPLIIKQHMTGRDVLELTYDILAQNEVSQEDRDRVKDALQYVDYDHYKIVIGGNDLRIYDHEEEE